MRGEHLSSTASRVVAVGSSPHARGTLRQAGDLVDHLRLIPACAGNTPAASSASAAATAHPRMRGEHPVPQDEVERDAGSSPHARGTRCAAAWGGQLRRLIPACAGNTSNLGLARRCEPAHPRMRGEHGKPHVTAHLARGSSPHARGTPPAEAGLIKEPRLIPACAGNTDATGDCGDVTPAHPRMRGEHHPRSVVASLPGGSSPHARGTREPRIIPRHQERLIPACAGNTRHGLPVLSRPAAHPRMRGEHRFYDTLSVREIGSSPHARGTPWVGSCGCAACRLIPACAGNTPMSRPAIDRRAAHPRMRGEHARGGNDGLCRVGSSPHARGTHPTPPEGTQALRLIPACAGNT